MKPTTMTRRRVGAARGLVVCGLALAIFSGPAAWAQEQAGQIYKPPRNLIGQPDIGGNWTNVTLTPMVRPAGYGLRAVHSPEEVQIIEHSEAEKNAAAANVILESEVVGNVGAYDRAWIDGGDRVMRVGGQPRTSLITTPDGQPPMPKGAPARTVIAGAGSPEAGLKAAREAAARDVFEGQGSTANARAGNYDNPEGRSLGERCIISFGRSGGPPMFPNGFYNNNYQFVQTADHVAIRIEMVHDVRLIRLNTDEHLPAHVRPWFGDSIGRWEGDTLVVETTNIPQAQAFQGAWRDLKVTERFRRVSKGRMLYQFTVEDKSVWDKPWGGEYEFAAQPAEIYEYACHEGNYGLENILAGARQEEREAARSQARQAD